MNCYFLKNTPGVVNFIEASDIKGMNNWRPKGWHPPSETQEVSSKLGVKFKSFINVCL